MKEYFVNENSFGAPFFSDTSSCFVKGKDPLDAIRKAVKKYKHPCGLYSARLYESADAFHKNKKALAKFDCNVVIKQELATEGKGCYSLRHDRDSKGEFIEVDGEKHYIENPKGGICELVKP